MPSDSTQPAKAKATSAEVAPSAPASHVFTQTKPFVSKDGYTLHPALQRFHADFISGPYVIDTEAGLIDFWQSPEIHESMFSPPVSEIDIDVPSYPEFAIRSDPEGTPISIFTFVEELIQFLDDCYEENGDQKWMLVEKGWCKWHGIESFGFDKEKEVFSMRLKRFETYHSDPRVDEFVPDSDEDLEERYENGYQSNSVHYPENLPHDSGSECGSDYIEDYHSDMDTSYDSMMDADYDPAEDSEFNPELDFLVGAVADMDIDKKVGSEADSKAKSKVDPKVDSKADSKSDSKSQSK